MKMTDNPDKEDKERGASKKDQLVGIMYSEKSFVVPHWIKVAFFFFAVALIGGLLWHQVDKRLVYRRLLVDSVVEPAPTGAVAAPDFVLPEGQGGKGVQLSQLKGQWVFVNFWATWCPPCRDEMPSMEMLNRRFKDRMVMVAISVDEDWGEVQRFFGDTNPTFKVAWDRSKTTAMRYGTRKFPETFLIAPDGTVAAKFVGPRDWYNQATVNYFEGVLSGKRAPTS
jgi:thiol-disulfide isomerase/thioredoxin